MTMKLMKMRRRTPLLMKVAQLPPPLQPTSLTQVCWSLFPSPQTPQSMLTWATPGPLSLPLNPSAVGCQRMDPVNPRTVLIKIKCCQASCQQVMCQHWTCSTPRPPPSPAASTRRPCPTPAWAAPAPGRGRTLMVARRTVRETASHLREWLNQRWELDSYWTTCWSNLDLIIFGSMQGFPPRLLDKVKTGIDWLYWEERLGSLRNSNHDQLSWAEQSWVVMWYWSIWEVELITLSQTDDQHPPIISSRCSLA